MAFAIAPAVWLLAQVDASAPPGSPTSPGPAVVATPWPVELPCRHPRTYWFGDRFDGTLTWASADGADARSFTVAKSRQPRRLPGDFPVARLTRLSGAGVDANIAGTIGGVSCRGDIEIQWGPCALGMCEVSATYLGRPLPKSKQRTRHWTDAIPGSPWADVAPEAHWTRFHREIAHKKEGDPTAAREAMRFSRAFAVELRDVLASACVGRRCAPPAAEAARALALYLRDPSPNYANAAQHAPDHWHYEWSWTATGGGVSLRISCDDMLESPDLLCDLSVDLPGRGTLEYGTFHRWVELYAAPHRQEQERPLGRITDAAADAPGPPTIGIDGQLLELRDGARAKGGQ